MDELSRGELKMNRRQAMATLAAVAAGASVVTSPALPRTRSAWYSIIPGEVKQRWGVAVIPARSDSEAIRRAGLFCGPEYVGSQLVQSWNPSVPIAFHYQDVLSGEFGWMPVSA